MRISAQVSFVLRGILQSMQESIENASAHATPDFAGLLAALAAAKPNGLPPWNDEQLSQDVATLSYERAMRTHARYRADDMVSLPAQQERAPARDERASKRAMPIASKSAHERKCASITLRMSQVECEQLRERAAEAGMTISAYLRSCTFEAEVLRSQVKEALAEMRRAPASQAAPQMERERSTCATGVAEHASGRRLGWLRRLIPDLHSARNVARV